MTWVTSYYFTCWTISYLNQEDHLTRYGNMTTKYCNMFYWSFVVNVPKRMLKCPCSKNHLLLLCIKYCTSPLFVKVHKLTMAVPTLAVIYSGVVKPLYRLPQQIRDQEKSTVLKQVAACAFPPVLVKIKIVIRDQYLHELLCILYSIHTPITIAFSGGKHSLKTWDSDSTWYIM